MLTDGQQEILVRTVRNSIREVARSEKLVNDALDKDAEDATMETYIELVTMLQLTLHKVQEDARATLNKIGDEEFRRLGIFFRE